MAESLNWSRRQDMLCKPEARVNYNIWFPIWVMDSLEAKYQADRRDPTLLMEPPILIGNFDTEQEALTACQTDYDQLSTKL